MAENYRENYLIKIENGQVTFKDGGNAPGWAFAPKLDLDRMEKGAHIVCRMGDPSLTHCAVFTVAGKPGGIFSVYDKNGILFCAEAKTNLAFAIAQGYFGSLTANARYGVDVFENMEMPDD